MISIIDKSLCCGCGACFQICPRQCIKMVADEEGFLNPQVNKDSCINCGLCEKVCHELNPYDAHNSLRVYAALNKDEDTRLRSSSGGVFSLLAESIINAGGVVFGAKFNDGWQVVISHAETMDDVKAFMGSKYVQASTETSYKDAEAFLKEGRQVMYSGTPCQIAGLHHYLRKPYENLLTVDVACHGVPSPKVWGRYLNEITGGQLNAIHDIQFRNKDNGWKRFNFEISYSVDGNHVHEVSFHRKNIYMQAFLKNMILRPSCHDCKAKCGSSKSDVTIADFWGIKNVNPQMDDDKGTGLVIVNTEKGAGAIELSKAHYHEEKYEDALKYNSALERSVSAHPKRDAFFSQLDKSASVVKLIEKQLRPSLFVRVRQRIKKLLHF